ncbi:MAG: hypothetical protein E2O93_06990 [Alphaproteobacteria bacterium]|nr:MAG: hypothetical protein E2O93_06990 [Alphaproteobacteria bacterium]
MGFFANLPANLSGAWDVMNGRVEGLRKLDITIDGFWRSFGAVALILPVAVIAMASERVALSNMGHEGAALTGGYMVLRFIAVIVDWLAFPAILALFARPMGIATHFVPYIVARNWAAVLIAGLFAVPHLFHALGILPTGMLSFILLGLFALAVWFSYIIVRTALQVPPVLAVPVVILEIVGGFVIELGFDRLAG